MQYAPTMQQQQQHVREGGERRETGEERRGEKGEGSKGVRGWGGRMGEGNACTATSPLDPTTISHTLSCFSADDGHLLPALPPSYHQHSTISHTLSSSADDGHLLPDLPAPVPSVPAAAGSLQHPHAIPGAAAAAAGEREQCEGVKEGEGRAGERVLGELEWREEAATQRSHLTLTPPQATTPLPPPSGSRASGAEEQWRGPASAGPFLSRLAKKLGQEEEGDERERGGRKRREGEV
jgi:hypothetical protein